LAFTPDIRNIDEFSDNSSVFIRIFQIIGVQNPAGTGPSDLVRTSSRKMQISGFLQILRTYSLILGEFSAIICAKDGPDDSSAGPGGLPAHGPGLTLRDFAARYKIFA
jgi:hypothetical protein